MTCRSIGYGPKEGAGSHWEHTSEAVWEMATQSQIEAKSWPDFRGSEETVPIIAQKRQSKKKLLYLGVILRFLLLHAQKWLMCGSFRKFAII